MRKKTKKEKIVKNLYIGDIYKCVSLTKSKKSICIYNQVIESRQKIIETTAGEYMKLSDYLNGNDKELLLAPTNENDIFIEKSYLKQLSLE